MYIIAKVKYKSVNNDDDDDDAHGEWKIIHLWSSGDSVTATLNASWDSLSYYQSWHQLHTKRSCQDRRVLRVETTRIDTYPETTSSELVGGGGGRPISCWLCLDDFHRLPKRTETAEKLAKWTAVCAWCPVSRYGAGESICFLSLALMMRKAVVAMIM